jgi:hypothetical protein
MTFRTAPESALAPPVEQRKNGGRTTTTIVLILVLGAILRVGIFLISNADPISRQLEPDSLGYLTLAVSLRSGTGFGRDVAGEPTQAPSSYVPLAIRLASPSSTPSRATGRPLPSCSSIFSALWWP